MRSRLLTNLRVAAFAAGLLLALNGDIAAAGEEAPFETAPVRWVLTAGNAQKVAVYGIGASWEPSWDVDALARRGFKPGLGVDLMRWEGSERDAASRLLWDASITPRLRWRPAEGPWHRLFMDIGVGIHLLSSRTINVSRNFSTTFQFGERLAVGSNFGPRNRYEVAVFAQHVSNGGIKEPNDGLTYYGTTIGISFD